MGSGWARSGSGCKRFRGGSCEGRWDQGVEPSGKHLVDNDLDLAVVF
jgi:hypothetical protein